MPDDTPARRSDFSARLNGIPSAMDELQYRRVIRDFGNIEAKGLQQRASASEIARVHAHLTEIYTHNAINASQMRDIAASELTAEEFARFDAMLKEVENGFHQAQMDAVRSGYGQMHDNITSQPIPTARQNASDEFIAGIKDVFGFNRKKREHKER
jgi:hypothetical protein